MKFFDNSYNFLGSAQSLDTLSSSSQKDTWSTFNIDATTVNGTEIIQACIVFEQGTLDNSNIYDDGSVYIDNLALYDCENSDCQQLNINQNIIFNKFNINSVYPNPFNPVSTINYEVAHFSNISLKIYDIAGREVAELVNGQLEPGQYSINWNASKFSSGLYFVKLTTENFTQSQKIMLIK